MTATEQSVLEALLELERAAAAVPAGAPRPNLLPILERLDHLTDTLPLETAPDLRHYLQRKSYEKARLFLLGRNAENRRGTCGH